MQELEEIYKVMEKRLKTSRYQHTLGVVETAKTLAAEHGVNVHKAELAALLHDYGKYESAGKLLKFAKDHSLYVDEVVECAPTLLHGEVGAILVSEDLGIKDEDILNAIRYHTYGRVGMSGLEKVIYISDAIEPGRSYTGVEELRELAKRDLDGALKRTVSDSIQFVVRKGHALHHATIALWNDLILNDK